MADRINRIDAHKVVPEEPYPSKKDINKAVITAVKDYHGGGEEENLQEIREKYSRTDILGDVCRLFGCGYSMNFEEYPSPTGEAFANLPVKHDLTDGHGMFVIAGRAIPTLCEETCRYVLSSNQFKD